MSIVDRLPVEDFLAGDDGFVVFWPIPTRGGFTAHDLKGKQR